MTGWLLLFLRLIVRPLWREPARTSLTVFAVALGVGVVIAMNLAGQSAAEGFHASVESLAGHADAEITMAGGIDERLLARLVQLPYAFNFSPRIEDFAYLPRVTQRTGSGRIAPSRAEGEAIPFFGLDLIGDTTLESTRRETANTKHFDTARPMWVGSHLGWKQGQTVHLILNDHLQEFTVQGILRPQEGQLAEANLVVADIGLAQLVTGKTGRLDSIAVTIPPGETFDQARRQVQSVLPRTATIEPRGTRREQHRRMLEAFRWNLRILSYISLLVGAFLIYNTISISVVRRRSDIGVVRALGMTRQMVLSAFIAEALFFGSVGSLLGIAVGRLMANGAVLMVNGTVQSLYVTSRAAPLTLSLDALISGVGLGLLVSLLAALPPAFEAAQVPPIEAMAHGRIEFVVGTRWPVTLPAIFVCAALAALLAKLPPVHRQPFFGYLSVLFLITATAIATPAAVVLFTRLVSRITAKLLQVEGLLAARSLRASLGRTSILTAALTTAIAMTASVGIMVGSFRTTLVVWMNDQLKADLYLRPAAIPGADRYPTMAPTIIDRLQQLPFIAALDLFRSYPIVYDGLPANLAGGNSNRISSLPIEDKLSGEDRESITRQLASGDYALVSEPFASKHDVHPGSVLTLPLAGTNRPFKVLAVYYDYSTERGLIMLDRKTLLRYLPDPALSSAAIYLKPGVDRQYARRLINELLGGSAVFIADNAALRRAALQIVDNTFRITYALEAVAIFVAVMGVAGALLSLVIDRKRELALLRFLGAAKIQIRRIILCEAALLGLLATLLGLILGSLLSLILIFVINKQSFGWTLQFHVPVGMLTAVLISVYAATLMAALYPSHIAMRLNPVEVIHEE